MKISLATAVAIIACSLASPFAAQAARASHPLQDRSENQVTARLNQAQLDGVGVPSYAGVWYGQNPTFGGSATPEQIAQPPDDTDSLSIIE